MNRTTLAYRIVPLLVMAALTLGQLCVLAAAEDKPAPVKSGATAEPAAIKSRQTTLCRPAIS